MPKGGRFVVLCLSATLVLGLGACSSSKPDTPAKTTESESKDQREARVVAGAFMAAWKGGRHQDMWNLIAPELRAQGDYAVFAATMEQFRIERYDVKSVTMTGRDTANAQVSRVIEKTDGSIRDKDVNTLALKRVDGQWYILRP